MPVPRRVAVAAALICATVAVVVVPGTADAATAGAASAGFFKSEGFPVGAESQCSALLRDSGGDVNAPAFTQVPKNFFFMHIPKTAGTSFGGQLSSMIASFAKLPEMADKFKGHLRVRHCYDAKHLLPTAVGTCYDASVFPNAVQVPSTSLTLYKAHSGAEYAERLPTGTGIITMLRDPNALVRSRYLYQWRNAEPNPLPLAQWAQVPKNVRTVDNRQTRTLGGGLCCVPGKEVVNVGQADCADGIVEAVEGGIVPTRGSAPDTQGCTTDCDPDVLLRNAKRMLEEGVWFFGLVERYQESVAYFAWKLGIPPPCIHPALNTERAPGAVISGTEASINKTIDELTVLDRRLYTFAADLFERRWQTMLATLDDDDAPFPVSAYLPANLQPCTSQRGQKQQLRGGGGGDSDALGGASASDKAAWAAKFGSGGRLRGSNQGRRGRTGGDDDGSGGSVDAFDVDDATASGAGSDVVDHYAGSVGYAVGDAWAPAQGKKKKKMKKKSISKAADPRSQLLLDGLRRAKLSGGGSSGSGDGDDGGDSGSTARSARPAVSGLGDVVAKKREKKKTSRLARQAETAAVRAEPDPFGKPRGGPGPSGGGKKKRQKKHHTKKAPKRSADDQRADVVRVANKVVMDKKISSILGGGLLGGGARAGGGPVPKHVGGLQKFGGGVGGAGAAGDAAVAKKANLHNMIAKARARRAPAS